MPSLDESYSQLIADLLRFYGQPALRVSQDSPFAAVMLAGLNRGAPGKENDPLVAALDRSGLLEPETLAAAAPDEVRDTLQEAKIELSPFAASLLVCLAQWYTTTFPEGIDPGDESIASAAAIRKQLSRINGVGSATAQSILLVLGRATFPLDRGTYRILVRHGWADCFTEPEEISARLGQLAGSDCREIARLGWWLSKVGRQFCGPGTPKCTRCPLRGLLPESGPVEPDS